MKELFKTIQEMFDAFVDDCVHKESPPSEYIYAGIFMGIVSAVLIAMLWFAFWLNIMLGLVLLICPIVSVFLFFGRYQRKRYESFNSKTK